MKSRIEELVYASGLWDGQQRLTHAVRLTPDAFVLSPPQLSSLLALGPAIVECLGGLSRLMAIAASGELATGSAWQLVREVMTAQVPRPFRELQALRPRQIPRIVKVDFMEDENGELKIAEIDAMNRRAMGYATLFAAARALTKPELASFPGIPRSLARELKNQGTKEAILLYSERERFYRPEFNVLRSALAAFGVTIHVVSEKEFSAGPGGFIAAGHPLPLATPLFSFPPLAESPELTVALAELYRAGKLRLLLPPKPGLGSKGLLGLISNPTQDQEIEAILRSQVNASALATVRAHLPASYLVGKRLELPPADKHYLLKEVVSAGTKGVLFSEDPGFAAALTKAKLGTATAILQEEVAQRVRVFNSYAEGDAPCEGAWYTRLVVYFIAGAPAEAVATGCQGKLVHGGKEALEFGVGFQSADKN